MEGTENMFEGFDFTNFWEDSAYALEEYVNKPPSDELIASANKNFLESKGNNAA